MKLRGDPTVGPGWFFGDYYTQRRVTLPDGLSDAQRTLLVRLIREAVARQADLAANCPAILRVDAEVTERGDALIITHEPAAPLHPGGLIATAERPDLTTCEWISDALAEALGAAERARQVHGGILLETIFTDRLGCVKLGDFGIASGLLQVCPDDSLHVVCEGPRAEDRTESGRWTLAPATEHHRSGWLGPFLPHEHFLGAVAPTLRYDQFSVGVVLYLLASGRHPYEAEVDLADPTLNQRWVDVPAPLAELRNEWREPLERTLKGLGQALDKRIAAWIRLVERLAHGVADSRFPSWSEARTVAPAPEAWQEARAVLAGAQQLLADLAFDQFLSITGRWIDDDAGLPALWRACLEAFIAEVERDRAKLMHRHELELRLGAAEKSLGLLDYDGAAKNAASVLEDPLADERLREWAERVATESQRARREADERASLAYGEYLTQASGAIDDGRLDEARTTLGALLEAPDLPGSTRTTAVDLIERLLNERMSRAEELLARRDFDAVRRAVEIALNDAQATAPHRERGTGILGRAADVQLEVAREHLAAGVYEEAIENANAVVYSGDATAETEQAARDLIAQIEATRERIAAQAARLIAARELFAAGKLDETEATLAPLRGEMLSPDAQAALEELDESVAARRAAYEECRQRLSDLDEAIRAGDVNAADGLLEGAGAAEPFEDLRAAFSKAGGRLDALRELRGQVVAAKKAFDDGDAEAALAAEERLSSRPDLPPPLRAELAALRTGCEAALEAQRDRLVAEARSAIDAARTSLEKGETGAAERSLRSHPAGFALLAPEEQKALAHLREEIRRIAAAAEQLSAADAALTAGDLAAAENALAAVGNQAVPPSLAGHRDRLRDALAGAITERAAAHQARCRGLLDAAAACAEKRDFDGARTQLDSLAAAHPPESVAAEITTLREAVARGTAARKAIHAANAALAAEKWDEAEASAARLAQREDLPGWAREAAEKIARSAGEGREAQRLSAIVEISELLDAAEQACERGDERTARQNLDPAAGKLTALPRADAALSGRLSVLKGYVSELERWRPRVDALRKQAAARDWLTAYQAAEAARKDAALPTALAPLVRDVADECRRAIAARQKEIATAITALRAEVEESGRRVRRFAARVGELEADPLATQEHLDGLKALRGTYAAVPKPSGKGGIIAGGIVGAAAVIGVVAWAVGLFGSGTGNGEPNREADDSVERAIAAELNQVQDAWRQLAARVAADYSPQAQVSGLRFSDPKQFPTSLVLALRDGGAQPLDAPFNTAFNETTLDRASDAVAGLAPTSPAFLMLFEPKAAPPDPWPAALAAAQSAFDKVAAGLGEAYEAPPAWRLAFEPPDAAERRLVARRGDTAIDIGGSTFSGDSAATAAEHIEQNLNDGHNAWSQLFTRKPPPPDPWPMALAAVRQAFGEIAGAIGPEYEAPPDWQIEFDPPDGDARQLLARLGAKTVTLSESPFTAETAGGAAADLRARLTDQHPAWGQLFAKKVMKPATPPYPAWATRGSVTEANAATALDAVFRAAAQPPPAWRDLAAALTVAVDPPQPSESGNAANVTVSVALMRDFGNASATLALSRGNDAWSIANAAPLAALTSDVQRLISERQSALLSGIADAARQGNLVAAHDALDEIADTAKWRPLDDTAAQSTAAWRSRLPSRWRGPTDENGADPATGYPRALTVGGIEFRLINLPPGDRRWEALTAGERLAKGRWPEAPIGPLLERAVRTAQPDRPWLLGYVADAPQPGVATAAPAALASAARQSGLSVIAPSLDEWLVLASGAAFVPSGQWEICRDPSDAGVVWYAGGCEARLEVLGGRLRSDRGDLAYLLNPLVTRRGPVAPTPDSDGCAAVRWMLIPPSSAPAGG